MKLKEIEIGNYRQFRKERIKFDENITFLAGANNSGKTSIIEFLKNIIESPKCSLSKDDLPLQYSNIISKYLFRIVKKVTNKHESIEDQIYHLTKLVKSTSPTIYMNLEVSYNKTEYIGRFSDYLMDLNENVHSFYFRFEYKHNTKDLIEIIKEKYKYIYNGIKELEERQDINYQEKLRAIQLKLLNYYLDSFEPIYYYTDRYYKVKEKMERREFQELFHFNSINANKRLYDENIDKKHSIGTEILNYVSLDSEWKNIIETLPEEIKGVIESHEVKELIKGESVDRLEETINELKKTNGGKNENVFLDFDIKEEIVVSFINNIIKAKYQIGNMTLDENSQGLGYSNLIFIHLKLERFLRETDNSKVNLFLIEEPEVHMHPQMQRVFIEYLKRYYDKKRIQGLITTHSSEIIKVTKLSCIKIIRNNSMFQSKVHDMSMFLDELKKEEVGDYDLKKFYNQFFNLNLSELIFADRAILYEGDTERMYIQSLISNENNKQFDILDNLYIAYVQVGGAHAHKYKHILDFLNIKSVILTDIDYTKSLGKIADIENSSTSNGALKAFIKKELGNIDPTIQDLYKWKTDRKCKLINIQFQDNKDFYSRTLEEAMLSKYLNEDVEHTKTRNEWKKIKEESELIFSIPDNKDKITIRDIVKSTGNSKKTDFMYSVITTENCFKMLPNYIEEGLEWLKR